MIRKSTRQRRIYQILILAAILMVSVDTAISQQPNPESSNLGEDILKPFASLRKEQMLTLAKTIGIEPTAETQEIFRSIEMNDFKSASNQYAIIRQNIGQYKGSTSNPKYHNELWQYVLETFGTHEQFHIWTPGLLRKYAYDILDPIPANSIYFGGTDPGRFVITAFNAVNDERKIHVITQNALADWNYLEFARRQHADHDIWLPSKEDSAKAFQQYVEGVRSGKIDDKGTLEIKSGRVNIRGALGVMQINGIIVKMIFENNKDSHEFYLEESYIIDWMYPYLEPHGLIMKLNKTTLDKLSEEVVSKDRKFWKQYVGQLQKHPEFADNLAAQKSFSKLRTAIAGLYEFHELYDEAEAAFRQAIRLWPEASEASFRLAKMYEKKGQIDEARKVINTYIEQDPHDSLDKAKDYLADLDNKRPLNPEEKKEITELILRLGGQDASVRGDAKKRLEGFGSRSLAMLKQHVENKDPEIRITVRELIKQMEK
ncbi:tetratricopeptide repeat protein [Verrucomicrobiota bacterium]